MLTIFHAAPVAADQAGAPPTAPPGPSSSLFPSPAAGPRFANAVMGREQVALAINRHAVAPAHLEKFSQFARENDMVIVVRASTPGSDRYKLAGHATKPMTVKAKTCDAGIARALVCRDPHNSKLRGHPDQIRLAEDNISALLQDPASGICAVPLLLSGDDIADLCRQGQIACTGNVEAGKLDIDSADGHGGVTRLVAKPAGEGLYAISYPGGAPLEVLASSADLAAAQSLTARKCAQLTADYDLALIAPRVHRRDSRHNVRMHSLQKDFIGDYKLKSAATFPVVAEEQEYTEPPLTEIQRSLFGDATFGKRSAAPSAPMAVKNLIEKFENLARPVSAETPGHANAARRISAELMSLRSRGSSSGRSTTPFDPDHKELGALSPAEHSYILALNNLFAQGAPAGRHCPDLIHHGPANNILSSDDDYADSVIFFPRTLDGCDDVAMANNKATLDAILRVAGANGYPCLFERPSQFPHRPRTPSIAESPSSPRSPTFRW